MLNHLDIFIVVLIWFVGWGIYFLAWKKNFKLARNADLGISYFLLLAVLTFLIFKNILPSFVINNLPLYFIAILVTFITVNHIYFVIRKNFKEPLVLLENHPTDRWLSANRQSIFITSSHILFQQVIITALIILLYQKFKDLNSLILSFGLVFGLMHVPLIFIKGIKFTILYTTPAVLSALIFPILFIKVSGGFILNYIVHWSFYALLTYIFWHKQGRSTSNMVE